MPAAVQSAIGSRPTVRSVPGPRKRTASKRRSFSWPRPLLQHRDVRLPGGDRVVVAQAHRPANGVPQPREVRLAEDLLGPTRRREGDDRPRGTPVVERRPDRPPQVGHQRFRDPGGIESREEVRLGLADNVDHRRPALRLLLHPLEHPRRRPADDVVRRVRGLLAAQVQVDVVAVHAPRPLGVRDPGDRPHERRVLDVAEHGHVLAGLEVDADADGEPRVLLELFGALTPESVGVHGSTLPARRIAR